MKLEGKRIVLEIVYDREQCEDPADWDWVELLDMAGHENVHVKEAEDWTPDPKLIAELEDMS